MKTKKYEWKSALATCFIYSYSFDFIACACWLGALFLFIGNKESALKRHFKNHRMGDTTLYLLYTANVEYETTVKSTKTTHDINSINIVVPLLYLLPTKVPIVMHRIPPNYQYLQSIPPMGNILHIKNKNRMQHAKPYYYYPCMISDLAVQMN